MTNAEHYKSMYEDCDEMRRCLELIIKEKNQIIEQLLKEMAERSKEEAKE